MLFQSEYKKHMKAMNLTIFIELEADYNQTDFSLILSPGNLLTTSFQKLPFLSLIKMCANTIIQENQVHFDRHHQQGIMNQTHIPSLHCATTKPRASRDKRSRHAQPDAQQLWHKRHRHHQHSTKCHRVNANTATGGHTILDNDES